MKNIFPVFFVVLTAFIGCKKASPGDDIPKGNYIKIDNDTRQLGEVPSTDVSVHQTDAYLPEGLLLNISVSHKTDNINEAKNDFLLITLYLYEGGPSNTEYNVVSMLNPPPSSANITFFLSGIDVNLQMTGKSGKLYVTRDTNNKITSIKFDNVDMNGTYEATVSSYMEIH